MFTGSSLMRWVHRRSIEKAVLTAQGLAEPALSEFLPAPQLFSKNARASLDFEYNRNKYPDDARITALAREHNVTSTKVRFWFLAR